MRPKSCIGRSRIYRCSIEPFLVFGEMNEQPGARFRVGLTGVTIAEYFREEKHLDVLFLIDNIFRFVQAGAEVSGLLGRLPPESVISPHWAQSWLKSRIGYAARSPEPSLPFKLSMCQPMILLIRLSCISSATCPRRSSYPENDLTRDSTQPSIPCNLFLKCSILIL